MADEILGSLGIEIVGDYSGLQPDIDAALSIAQAGADKISSALAEALKTPDIAPVTEAFTQVNDAGKSLADNLTGVLAIDLGTPDISNFTGVVDSLQPMADAAAQGVAASTDVQLEAPDASAVTEVTQGVTNAAEVYGKEMAAAYGIPLDTPDIAAAVQALTDTELAAQSSAEKMAGDYARPLEAPDNSPVVEVLTGIDDVSASSAGEMSEDFSRELGTPDASPVTEVLVGVEDVAAGSAEIMSDDFARELQPPDPAAVDDVLTSVDDVASSSAGEMAQDFAVPLEAPDVTPVTGAIDSIATSAESAVQPVQDLAGRVQQLLDTGEAATTAQALAIALGEMGQNAKEADSGVASLASDVGGLIPPMDDLVDSVSRYSDGAKALFDRQSAADGELARAQDILREVQTAFDDDEASAAALARAASDVEKAFSAAHPEIKNAATATKEAGDSAKDAKPAVDQLGASFEDLAGKLAGIAGFSLTIAGLVELGKKAIEAGDRIDDATHALTTLGGSATAATKLIGDLKNIAQDEGLSFPPLVKAAVNFTNLLESTKGVADLIKGIGNASEELNKPLESMESALEGIIARGDVSARQLKTLGLTMDDVRGAMDNLGASADDTFKQFDRASQVEIITEAFHKFDNEARILNDDTGGNLKRGLNELIFVLEELGTALEPVTYAITQAANNQIPNLGIALKSVVEMASYVVTGLKLATDAVVGFLATAIEGIKGYVTVFVDLMAHDFKKAVQDAGDALDNLKAIAKKSSDDMVADATAGVKFVADLYGKDLPKATSDAEEGLGKLVKKSGEVGVALDSLRKATHDFLDTSTLIPTAEQNAADAAAAHQAKLDSLQTSIDHVRSNLDVQVLSLAKAKENYDLWGGSMAAVEQAQKRVNDAETLLNSLQKELDSQLGDTTIPGQKALKDALDKVNQEWFDGKRAIDEIKPALTPLEQAYKDLGLNIDGTVKSTKDLVPEFNRVIQAGANTSQLTAAWEKVSGAVSKLAKVDLPAATAEVGHYAQAQIDAGASQTVINTALGEYEGYINKLAKVDLPAAADEQSRYIQMLKDTEAPWTEINKAILLQDQYEIQLAADQKTSNSQWVIDAANRKKAIQDEADSVKNILGKAYVDVMQVWDDAWTDLGKHVTDGITGAKSWHDAWQGFLGDIEHEIVDKLVKDAFNSMESGLDGIIGKVKSLIFGDGGAGGGLVGLGSTAVNAGGDLAKLGTYAGDAAKDALSMADKLSGAGTQAADMGGKLAGAGSSVSSSAGSLGGAFGSLGGTINVVSGAVSAVTGVIGLFQQHAANASLSLIELNTRISAIVQQKELPLANAIATEQELTLNSLWASILYTATQEYNRLGDIWNQLRELQQHVDLVGDGIYQLGHGEMSGPVTATAKIDGASIQVVGPALNALNGIWTDSNLLVEGIRNIAIDIQNLNLMSGQAAAQSKADFQGLFATGVHIGNTLVDMNGNVIKTYTSVQQQTTETQKIPAAVTALGDKVDRSASEIGRHVDGTTTAVTTSQDKTATAVDRTTAAVDRVSTAAKDAGEAVSGAVRQGRDAIVTSVDKIPTIVRDSADRIVTSTDNTRSSVDRMGKDVTGAVNDARDHIGSIVDRTRTDIITSVTDARDHIGSKIDRTGQDTVTAINTARDHIGSTVDRARTDIVAAVGNIPRDLGNLIASSIDRAGRAAGQVAADGAKAGGQTAADGARDAGATVASSVDRSGRDTQTHVDDTTTAVAKVPPPIVDAVSKSTTATQNVPPPIVDAVARVGDDIQNMKPAAYDPNAAAALAAGPNASNVIANEVWGNKNAAATLESFFHTAVNVGGKNQYLPAELDPAIQALADLAKKLGMSIPLGIDAANRLTYVNAQGVLASQTSQSTRLGIGGDTTQTVGSHMFNGDGSFNWDVISKLDPGFKADPAIWNALIKKLLETGITGFNADSLAANVNFANDQTGNSDKNLPISGTNLNPILDWIKQLQDIISGTAPSGTGGTGGSGAGSGGGGGGTTKDATSGLPPVDFTDIQNQLDAATGKSGSGAGSLSGSTSGDLSGMLGDQSGILSQIDDDLRKGFTAVVDSITGTTDAINFGTSSAKSTSGSGSSSATGGIPLSKTGPLVPAGAVPIDRTPSGGISLPTSGPVIPPGAVPIGHIPPTGDLTPKITAPVIGGSAIQQQIDDLQKQIDRDKYLAFLGQKNTSDIAAEQRHLAELQSQLAGGKSGALPLPTTGPVIPPNAVPIPKSSADFTSTIADLLSGAMKDIPPGAIKIPPLPAVPKTTAPTGGPTAEGNGGIVLNNATFNLKGIENIRELWKQLMAEAKKLTPTAVPFSQ